MDKDWLSAQLGVGRSYEKIAAEVGCHPSTVAYWARRYGLASTHAPTHAARGDLSRETLAAIVAQGKTVREIAEDLDRSFTTIRHWLRKYGLKTARSTRLRETSDARASGSKRALATCSRREDHVRAQQ